MTRSSSSASKPSAPPCTSVSSKKASPAPPRAAARPTPPGSTAASAPSPTSTTDRHPHRDHRQPHARASPSARQQQLPRNDLVDPIKPAALALRPVHRLRADQQPRRPRLCLPRAHPPALQLLPHGQELHSDAAARTTGPSHPSASTPSRAAASRQNSGAPRRTAGGDALTGSARQRRRPPHPGPSRRSLHKVLHDPS